MRTKLNKEVQDTICQVIANGHYQETAARLVGITPQTLCNWLARGREEEEGIYFEFFEAVEKAKAAGEIKDLAVINNAAQDGSWQAAAWKLERKFPHRWGRMVRAEVSGVDGQPIKVDVDAKSELKRLLGLLDDDPAV